MYSMHGSELVFYCYKNVWKKCLSLAALFSLRPCVGFSTFNDVTYPLVTQTVITNGKLWSFYVYQLNTTLLHGEHTFNNPRHNLCWGTPELKLFEAIEDGKVIGKWHKFPLFNFECNHTHITFRASYNFFLTVLVVL
jgi:hypothetical protein